MKSDKDFLVSSEVERFFRAIETGDKTLIKGILAEHPSLVGCRSATRHNATPLHIAAASEDFDIVSLLIEFKADLELANDFGLTPLAMCPPSSQSFQLLSKCSEAKEHRRDAVRQVDSAFQGL